MTVSEAPAGVQTGVQARVVERSLAPTRDRVAREVDALVGAGMRVMEQAGAAGTTVAAVLAEAGLSTRAFYRHFASKDDLLIAVYEAESESAAARLRARIDAAPHPRAALETWVGETLALAFSTRRASRTRVLLAEGRRLEATHPGETDAIVRSQLRPLVEVLERGRAEGVFPGARPQDDATTIYAVVMALVADRLEHGERRGSATASLAAARAHVLRICLPALEGA
jgi:AcrR family transcriptional regulator